MSEKINSRNKGSKNERDICKLFHDWTGYEFSRTPSSGGLRWKATDNTVGDIVCTDDKHSRRFKFTIEAKFYQDINFEHLILGNSKVKILEFWEQALSDAERSGKIPLLFMRYNRMPKNTHFVAIQSEIYLKIYQLLGKEYGTLSYAIKTEDKNYSFVLINSNDLISSDYQELHKLARDITKQKKKNGN